MILLEEHDGFIRNSKKAEQISVYLSEHTYLKPHITILSKVWVWNRRNWYFKIIYVEDKTLCSTEAKVTPIDWWSKISCVTHMYGPSDFKKSWVLKIRRRKFFFIFEDTKIERALLFSKSIFKQVFLEFLVLLLWSHSILIIDLFRNFYVDVFT